jgi:hypothetical protein
MRPGRLPENDPLEQQARDKLRATQGKKPEPKPPSRWHAHLTDDNSVRQRYVDRDVRRWT